MPDGKRRPVVKYALVPSGRGACGWCYMLSSNGYYYKSESTASRSKHEGCKCVVWPSSQASEIEGYDPEWMRKCWRDCCETVDYESVRRNAEREWERMDEAERSAYRKLDKKTRARIESLPEDIRKKVGLDDASLDKNAFDNYCGKRWLDEACNEVGRRDPIWLYEKAEPKAEYQKPRSLLEEHEKAGVDGLRHHGIAVTVPFEDPKAAANIDLVLWGKPYEMKNVTSESSISNQVKRARAKWRKLGRDDSMRVVVTYEDSSISFEKTVDGVRKRLRDGEEAIVLSRGGVRMIRINNGTVSRCEGLGVSRTESIAHFSPHVDASDRAFTEAGRGMSGSLRMPPSRIIADDEIDMLMLEAESIGIDPEVLSFNTGTRTSFDDATRKINVRGDVFPDPSSSSNRDRMTSRAVLAHEFYGHSIHSLGTRFVAGDWRDEFRASYRAAIDTPGLTDEERASLMVDAYERLAEAGVKPRYTRQYRRIVYGYE